MHIDSYTFGEMVIDGRSYTNDVLVHPGGIRHNWFRREGHELCLADIQEHLAGCARLIVGTGASGMVRIRSDVRDFCAKAGIEIIAQHTGKAVELFNAADHSTTVGAFHLTC